MREYMDLMLELFDTTKRIKWSNNDDEMIVGTFTVGKYRYSSIFSLFGEDEWEWVFEIDFGYGKADRLDSSDAMGILGTGNAPQVLSAVLSTLQTFIERFSPRVITFAADEDSRRKLYAAMVRRLAGKLPQGYETSNRGGEWFIQKTASTGLS